MIIATVDDSKLKADVLVIGLTIQECLLMIKGEPIFITKAQCGDSIPMEMRIIVGQTEQTMFDVATAVGAITPDTIVEGLPPQN